MARRSSRMATSLGRARLAVRGRMVLDGVQSGRSEPKTRACVDGAGWARVLVAWVRCVPFPRCSGNQGAVVMKRISIVGLCLAAVFSLSAVAASSASAGELLALIAPKGGSAAGVTFLSLGGLSLLTTHSGKLVHCKDVHNTGLFLTSTLGDILILFLGCTTKVIGNESCNTAGTPNKGEIHLPLANTLFHLGLAHLELSGGSFDRVPAVLILLNKDVLFTCGAAVHVLVLGAVIGALQLDEPLELRIPLGVPFLTALLNFSQTAHGLQHLRLFLLGGSLASYDLDVQINGGTAELAAQVSLDLLDLFLNSAGKHVDLELVEHP
jgi:hypothetical protein